MVRTWPGLSSANHILIEVLILSPSLSGIHVENKDYLDHGNKNKIPLPWFLTME